MHFSRIVVAELIDALDQGKVIPSVIERNPQFDWDVAYRVAAAIVKVRRMRGEKTVGRKIGFTNRNIWAEYGATAPIWAHIYDRTVQFADGHRAIVSLGGSVQPRLEPEIAFKLKAPLRAGVNRSRTGSRGDRVAGAELRDRGLPLRRLEIRACGISG